MNDVIAPLQTMVGFCLFLSMLGFVIYIKGLMKSIEEEGRKERATGMVFFVTGAILMAVGLWLACYPANCLWFIENSTLPPPSDTIPLMMH